MSAQLHLSVVLSNWAKLGHTQSEFATLSGVATSGISRMFKGEQHPDIDTLEQIVTGVAKEYPELARNIVEAYLLDHIPDATAPDGRPWKALVKIVVEEISSRVNEGESITEIDLAKMWFESRCQTPDGQRWLLTMYRWSNKPAKYS